MYTRDNIIGVVFQAGTGGRYYRIIEAKEAKNKEDRTCLQEVSLDQKIIINDTYGDSWTKKEVVENLTKNTWIPQEPLVVEAFLFN